MSAHLVFLGGAHRRPGLYAHINRSTVRNLIELGGVDFVRETFEVFVAEATSDIDKLMACVERQDFDELRKASHRIRGAAAMLGAEELEALCEQASHLAKHAQHATIPSHTGLLQQEFRAVLGDIDAAIADAQQ